ncbi:MAG: hypothetical protein IJM96_07380 [Clostridia bacterium]|nr:hypothetical protein [Clostridia bacterium]
MKKIIVWLTVVLFSVSVFKYEDNRESEIYKAVYPRRMDITDVLTVNGTVRENNRKDVYSETTLCIDSIYVKEGDTPKDLQLRVMEEAEWEILPKAIRMIADGEIKLG